MNQISIGSYEQSEKVGWKGWIGTEKWIVFEGLDGNALLFKREPEGGVSGDGIPLIFSKESVE